MIFLIGDTHQGQCGDFQKINTKNFPIQKELTKDDYVIILGDFGCLWDNSKSELYWQNWLNNKNFTTLFIDGNHENHDMLDALPVENWKGGKISKVSDSIFHLKRGQVFEIDGKKLFTMGGGVSVDKKYRKEGISWWANESPSKEQLDEGLMNLAKHNNEVDFILTHSAPKRFIAELSVNKGNKEFEIPLDFYLDDLYDNVSFKHWYCGHFHVDHKVNNNFDVLLNTVVLL